MNRNYAFPFFCFNVSSSRWWPLRIISDLMLSLPRMNLSNSRRLERWNLKPWPKRHTTSVQLTVHFVWPPSCDALHWLWLSSNSHTNQRKLFTVWPPNASCYKPSVIDTVQYALTSDMHEMYGFLQLASWLANPSIVCFIK